MKSVRVGSRNSVSGARPRFLVNLPPFATIGHGRMRGSMKQPADNQQPKTDNRQQVDSVSVRPLSGLVTLCPPCKTAGILVFSATLAIRKSAGAWQDMSSICHPFVGLLSALCQSFRTQHKQVFWRVFCRHSGALLAQAGGAGPDDRADDEIGYAREFPPFS